MKKILLCVGIIIGCFILTACDLDDSNTATTTTTTTTQVTTSEEDNYMDALRKCTVMEAADIYTTGVGKKSDNVFNDGREKCESFVKDWGKKEFIKAVNTDWENRKTEEIEGQPLTHYLEILGW